MRLAAFLAVLALLAPVAVSAKTTARFSITQVPPVCNVDDSETILTGDPELHYTFGIFDNSSSTVTGCGNGCNSDNVPETLDAKTSVYCITTSTCGTWNFPDVTMTKVIPGHSGAYFYFGLWDDDTDATDSMGDHWFYRSSGISSNSWNNNASPYYAGSPITQVCGDAVEGLGWASNYRLYYSITFTDDTPPSVPTPVHLENGVPSPVSTDLILHFQWDPAVDDDTGISGNYFTLEDVTAGTTVFNVAAAPPDRDLTICPSGCDATYTPVDGHAYRFRAYARNGSFPTISNQTQATSAWVDVGVSLLGVEDGAGDPALALAAPMPNPSPGPARTSFTLPRAGTARLAVYDLQGREVTRLRHGRLEAGTHDVFWDGRDRTGQPVSAGIYILRLSFDGEHRTRRLVVGS